MRTVALGTALYAGYLNTLPGEVPSWLLFFDFYPVLVYGL